MSFYLKENLPNTDVYRIRKDFQKFSEKHIPHSIYFENIISNEYKKKKDGISKREKRK